MGIGKMFRTDKLSQEACRLLGLPEAVYVYSERRSLFVAKGVKKEKSHKVRFFLHNYKCKRLKQNLQSYTYYKNCLLRYEHFYIPILE